jgi:hypothetical protein
MTALAETSLSADELALADRFLTAIEALFD